MRAFCQELRPWVLGGPGSKQRPRSEGVSPRINILTSLSLPPSGTLLFSAGSQRAQAYLASQAARRAKKVENEWIRRGR